MTSLSSVFFGGFCLGLMALSSTAMAASPSSLKDCASLLPQGSNYSINIQAEANRSNKNNEFHGNFFVTDNHGKQVKFTEKTIKPFLDCAMPLINGEKASF